MSNIVQFPSKPNLSFKVKAVTVDLLTDKDGNTTKKKHAIIILKNLSNGKEAIHPVSDFIMQYWKNREYNTMVSNAYHIAAFLNFVFFESDSVVEDLSELTSQHAVRFLNSLTIKGNQKSTVKKHEKTLVLFFEYLFESNILEIMTAEDLKNLPNSLQGVIYKSNALGNKIHDFKAELILPFIEFAYHEKNEIALGVYYQIFGGLRAGEVVNIKKSNIRNVGSYGEFGQVIKIKNTQLRPDLNTTSGKGEVKKDRTQVVFPYKTLLRKLYKEHTDRYSSQSNPDALFVDGNGNPMSGDNYIYHFSRLKEKFINHLLNSTDIRLQTYGQYLKSMKWGTHIGRGIFSNLMAEYTDNVLEIAVARGDSNLSSSLTYIADTERIMNKIQNELELLYTGDFLDK